MTALVHTAYAAHRGHDAPDYRAYATDPRRWRTIAGVPAELAKRIEGFARHGVDADRIVAAIRDAGPERGPATQGWTEKMTTIGERLFSEAEAAERRGETGSAERAFLESSFWFFLARFPHVLHPAGAAAYRRHNDAYMRAARHFAHPLERVSIPFQGKEAAGLLRTPSNAAPPFPLIILMGGIDVWKSDLELHGLAEKLLMRGVATLSLDIPGTGECPIFASPESECAPLGALAFARADERIDAARICVYGLSFGGYFATKLALLEPSLAAVVQNGGPIHHAFGSDNVRALPAGARAALARLVGLRANDDPLAIEDALGKLSLKAQGLLPAQANAPLLSINGARDELVPIADLYCLSEMGVSQDLLVFADDRHCASGARDLHEPFAIDWMLRRL